MADKKINQLDDAGALTVNDYAVVNQNHSTGKALKVPLGTLKQFFFDGVSGSGIRAYFPVGVPTVDLGVDGDIAFDVQNHGIYQKVSGSWILRDTYGTEGGVATFRFTATYGSGGLSGDGKTYTNTTLLQNNIVQNVRVEADDLIMVENFGDVPAFDEWDFDTDTGIIRFGSALPPGTRITVMYSM
ncbi:hypothetical protein [Chitinophaga sp. sic0106]|uniref:hypothetical protein n=1 Tax=Chitinophaga sp. sic0106 TaxID=2854785 RepID=UPI001C47A917|nr:hypothetical protein [Chitinophaga sp. sic0106]MBV7534053.1 hypothetical protein [Chitinophaga sp. sic0106]